MLSENVISIADLPALRERLQGRTIVLATGCFDILHSGHLYFLEDASRQGDVLIVGINSDRAVKVLKGVHRPIVSEGERVNLISAFRCVDYTFIYDDIVADDYIVSLKPDVFAIGEESVGSYPSEPASAKQVGARLHVVTRIPSASTTSIVANIQTGDSFGISQNDLTIYDVVNAGDEEHWRMSFPERYTFAALLQKIRPKLAIEVGTGFGSSLKIMSLFSEKVFTLDVDPDSQKYIDSLENVSFILGDSKETFPALLDDISENNLPLEFVFIDADHSFEGLRADLNNLMRHLPSSRLYFLIHDSFNPDSRRGLRSIDWSRNPYLHYIELDYVNGCLLASQEEYRQMWGGLCLGLLLPSQREGALQIHARAELSFQAAFCSIHNSQLIQSMKEMNQ